MKYGIHIRTAFNSFLVWNGVAWTRDNTRVKYFSTEKEARREKASLSMPRGAEAGFPIRIFVNEDDEQGIREAKMAMMVKQQYEKG